MTNTTEETNSAPRTDICEECDREILVEFKSFIGQHELIHRARTADEDKQFYPVRGGSATIRMYCRCGSVDVEFNEGKVGLGAREFPDGWMWEDEIEV